MNFRREVASERKEAHAIGSQQLDWKAHSAVLSQQLFWKGSEGNPTEAPARIYRLNEQEEVGRSETATWLSFFVGSFCSCCRKRSSCGSSFIGFLLKGNETKVSLSRATKEHSLGFALRRNILCASLSLCSFGVLPLRLLGGFKKIVTCRKALRT